MFEETGYPCKLLPLDVITRAPAAGAQTDRRYGDGRGRERRNIHGDSASDKGGQGVDSLEVREGVYGRLG